MVDTIVPKEPEENFDLAKDFQLYGATLDFAKLSETAGDVAFGPPPVRKVASPRSSFIPLKSYATKVPGIDLLTGTLTTHEDDGFLRDGEIVSMLNYLGNTYEDYLIIHKQFIKRDPDLKKTKYFASVYALGESVEKHE